MNRPTPEQVQLPASVSPAASTEGPRETGRRLYTFPRPGRYGKPATELRITLDAFEGHPFIGARVWTQGTDRQWYPTKSGITLRKGEILECIKALCAGARELGVDLHPKGGDGR